MEVTHPLSNPGVGFDFYASFTRAVVGERAKASTWVLGPLVRLRSGELQRGPTAWFCRVRETRLIEIRFGICTGLVRSGAAGGHGAPQGRPTSWLPFASADGTQMSGTCLRGGCSQGMHWALCSPSLPSTGGRGALGRVLLALVTLCSVSCSDLCLPSPEAWVCR